MLGMDKHVNNDDHLMRRRVDNHFNSKLILEINLKLFGLYLTYE